MLVKKEYYEIVIKDNSLEEVAKINSAKYNYYKNMFEYAYRTKSGKKYPLDKDTENGKDFIIIDDEHLYELMTDLTEKGFCDKEQMALALVRMDVC